jgi:diguanylate cyclase (GGDEF)-like protein
MSLVVERLAELTGFRDRDVLDVTLVAALKDLLRPSSVAIYRPVGEEGARRWLTRARLHGSETTPTADPLWAHLDDLPGLDEHPMRRDCLLSQETLSIAGPPALSYFPLATEIESIGVLEFATELPMSDAEWRLVCSILRIFRNFQGLLDYSERDTLTGLLNRKTFDESFLRSVNERRVEPAAPAAEPRRAGAGSLWLGLIDIDHFKAVNDGFGHLIGDEVLLLLSRLMRSSFRFHDRLYRFGGEEFVVLMRAADAAGAALAFERLRRNVEAYVFPRVGRITVSVGFTDMRLDDTPAAAFERADKAVYFVKEHGRNQVAHHGDLVERGLLAVDERAVGDVELF